MAVLPISSEAFRLLVFAVLFTLALLVIGGIALIGSLWRRGGYHPRVVGCRHCGRNVLPGTKVCPNCGEPVEN